jgi:uncharacterized protein YbaA (DUF1428 family)
MSYIDGFVAAVPADKKDAYRETAAKAVAMFKQWGATRVVENWGDDVPPGKQTDFYRAVAAKEGEVIVFSWVEYPDKATRDDERSRDGRHGDAIRHEPHDLWRL